MSATDHVRRAATSHPFHAAEAALLAVVVLATVAFGALASASAPVSTLWAATLAMILGGSLLPLVLLVHGAADLYALARADGWPSAVAVLRGGWRLLEVVLAVAFVFFLATAAATAEGLANNPGANPDARGTFAMVFFFGVGFALLFEAALVGAVSVRLVWTAAGAGSEDG